MTHEIYPMDREDCLARFAAMEKRIAALEQALEPAPAPDLVKPLTDDDYCDHEVPLNEQDCCPVCDAEFPPEEPST
tara:strand:- start:107 stop:334 length:228 start_codon:yes stop_codon:yes gene_type:complete